MPRTLPINDQNAQSNSQLKKALLTITMGVRVGPNFKSIGYIQELDRAHKRVNTHLKQLEPFVNGTFGGSSTNVNFNDTEYFPGETVEVAPGVLDNETITVKRAVLFTSTMFEAFMRAGGGGVNEDGIPAADINGLDNRYVSLLQQTRPIDVVEMYVSPIDGKIIWGVRYEDCWFADLSRNVTSKGDATIIESSTLDVTRTRQYFG
jgi:hypothetical protein